MAFAAFPLGASSWRASCTQLSLSKLAESKFSIETCGHLASYKARRSMLWGNKNQFFDSDLFRYVIIDTGNCHGLVPLTSLTWFLGSIETDVFHLLKTCPPPRGQELRQHWQPWLLPFVPAPANRNDKIRKTEKEKKSFYFTQNTMNSEWSPSAAKCLPQLLPPHHHPSSLLLPPHPPGYFAIEDLNSASTYRKLFAIIHEQSVDNFAETTHFFESRQLWKVHVLRSNVANSPGSPKVSIQVLSFRPQPFTDAKAQEPSLSARNAIEK